MEDDLKKMEDNLNKNGRRPQKTYGRRTPKKMEDDLKINKNGRRPQHTHKKWKTTSKIKRKASSTN